MCEVFWQRLNTVALPTHLSADGTRIRVSDRHHTRYSPGFGRKEGQGVEAGCTVDVIPVRLLQSKGGGHVL